MSFRQLMIAKACHLSIENTNIKIKHDGVENHIPIEDVSLVMIESREVTFSSTFFVSCAEHSIPIMICGRDHIPSSISLGINAHYRPYQVLNFQIIQTEKTKEDLTEALLKSKLKNQKDVLKLVGAEEPSIKLFNSYIESIKGHDEINREGTAAKVFFNQLYGNDFVRFQDDPINIAQNYGYSVFRACLSRHFTAYGFNLAFGINHCSQTNPLNLVYDFVEPFRAIVDYYIWNNLEHFTDKINIQTKKELVNLLNAKVEVNKKSVTIQYAMEMLVKSYLRILEQGEKCLDLPLVKEIDFNKLNESI